jgi:hypothetical protein
MEFNQSRVVHEKVRLGDATINDVAIYRLEQLLGQGKYLREKSSKQIITKDEDDWPTREEYVRDATELDLVVFKVLAALRDAKC